MIASFRWKSLPVLVALGIRRLGMLICVLRVLLRLGRMLLALGTVVSPGASATAQWDFAAVSAYTSIEPVWTFKDRGRSNKEKQKTDDACLHREIVRIAHWKPRLQSIQHGPVIRAGDDADLTDPGEFLELVDDILCVLRRHALQQARDIVNRSALSRLDDEPLDLRYAHAERPLVRPRRQAGSFDCAHGTCCPVFGQR
jgi:hypothetical protein